MLRQVAVIDKYAKQYDYELWFHRAQDKWLTLAGNSGGDKECPLLSSLQWPTANSFIPLGTDVKEQLFQL